MSVGGAPETEAAYREAIAAGDTDAWLNLGNLLAEQPGREGEAEAAYREAMAAGDTTARSNLGLLLAKQPGREGEAEAAYREAARAGDTDARFNLGNLLSKQPGREGEAEAAYREAIAAGDEHILAINNLLVVTLKLWPIVRLAIPLMALGFLDVVVSCGGEGFEPLVAVSLEEAPDRLGARGERV